MNSNMNFKMKFLTNQRLLEPQINCTQSNFCLLLLKFWVYHHIKTIKLREESIDKVIQLTSFSLSNRRRCSNGSPAPIGLGVFSFSFGRTFNCSPGVSWISSDRTRGMRRKTPFGPFCTCSGCISIDSLLRRPVALWFRERMDKTTVKMVIATSRNLITPFTNGNGFKFDLSFVDRTI